MQELSVELSLWHGEKLSDIARQLEFSKIFFLKLSSMLKLQ
jgi:hypothetical protein